MDAITYNELPRAVAELNEKVDRLLAYQEQSPEKQDRYFTLDQIIDYLPERPAKATVYGWVAKRQVPFNKEGKKLLFRKSEIDEWLSNGRTMKGLK